MWPPMTCYIPSKQVNDDYDSEWSKKTCYHIKHKVNCLSKKKKKEENLTK